MFRNLVFSYVASFGVQIFLILSSDCFVDRPAIVEKIFATRKSCSERISFKFVTREFSLSDRFVTAMAND